MISSDILLPYIISNTFSLALLAAAFMWPRAVRILFVIIFAGGGIFNIYTAITAPESYISFGNYTFLGFYRDFINGFFAEHVRPMVLLIAAGQLCTGALLTRRGGLLKLGVIGGVTFLVAIIPLGAGSAFPSTLVMAAGLATAYLRLDAGERLEVRGEG